MDILNYVGTVLFTSALTTLKDALVEAVAKEASLSGASLSDASLSGASLSGASLSGANLSGANLSDASLSGKKVHDLRVFTGLYRYQVWAVVFEDGSRMVRMGCLWKSLEDWETIGIRQSNLDEYPNDGSDKCEERVAAFEFARAAVLRMKSPDAALAQIGGALPSPPCGRLNTPNRCNVFTRPTLAHAER
jgi:uncharacterized protein YjbI with pentapeptide repeats